MIDPVMRADVANNSDFRCHYCGIPLKWSGLADGERHWWPEDEKEYYCVMQVDHLVPQSRGGTDDQFNLEASCGRCNGSKNAKTLSEYRLHKRFERRDFNFHFAGEIEHPALVAKPVKRDWLLIYSDVFIELMKADNREDGGELIAKWKRQDTINRMMVETLVQGGV